MPRPRNISKIQIPPRVKGFNPIGYYNEESAPLFLNLEEYEAIRLLDYENLSQNEAAVFMNVSRPTLTRIYERARKKIATALTESHQILIEGGHSIFHGEWYECPKCQSKFNNPGERKISVCPLCSSDHVIKL